MIRIKLRNSGVILVVVGKAPSKPGDRFEAVVERPDAPAPRERGCEVGELPGGGRFIACKRGGSSPAARDWPRAYRYDPAIHEVLTSPARGRKRP